jgi:hypothetical protein
MFLTQPKAKCPHACHSFPGAQGGEAERAQRLRALSGLLARWLEHRVWLYRQDDQSLGCSHLSQKFASPSQKLNAPTLLQLPWSSRRRSRARTARQWPPWPFPPMARPSCRAPSTRRSKSGMQVCLSPPDSSPSPKLSAPSLPQLLWSSRLRSRARTATTCAPWPSPPMARPSCRAPTTRRSKSGMQAP